MKAYCLEDDQRHLHFMTVSTDGAEIRLVDGTFHKEPFSAVGSRIRGSTHQKAEAVYRAARNGLAELCRVTQQQWREL